MSNLLVILGATGQQGSSVANFVVSDPELSKQYKVRGVTRDTTKDAAQALTQKGVEVVQGDLDDEGSIKKALQGAHTVFAMTSTVYDDQSKAREIRQGKLAADLAVAAGAKFLIWASQKHPATLTSGKYAVDSYDSKAEVETYIRGLPIQSAFFAPGSFMQNFAGMMAPRPAGDGTYAIGNILTGSAPFPWIDIVADTGKFVGAILAAPEKFNGKFLAAAHDIRSLDEVTQVMSKVSGKTIKYAQMPVEKYRGFLPPAAADTVVNMFLYIQDYGYYGPDTKKEVECAASQARTKLTTLEEYFAENPLKLE